MYILLVVDNTHDQHPQIARYEVFGDQKSMELEVLAELLDLHDKFYDVDMYKSGDDRVVIEFTETEYTL